MVVPFDIEAGKAGGRERLRDDGCGVEGQRQKSRKKYSHDDHGKIITVIPSLSRDQRPTNGAKINGGRS
jgi:hypothetical protein